MNSKKAYLILENGTIFEGTGFGYEKETSGEVVFTTSMVGYMEALTDPRYYGQMLVQTFPLIGNYGINQEDLENDKCFVNGYIVREWCQNPSNFRSEGDIDTFLKEKKVPGICGIDTRKLTKIIREEGTMRGKIAYELTQRVEFLKNPAAPAYHAADKNITIYQKENADFNVAVLNLGAKKSFFKSFEGINTEAAVFGPETKAEDIAAIKPDGIVITNGPGNPENYDEIIEQVEELMKLNVPVLGIGLGHQLMALAQGGRTEKLPYGHRGSSQPVLDINRDRIYITGQNHGYTVSADNIPDNAEITHTNVNDKTVEGLNYKDRRAFSVQFDPQPVTAEGPGEVFGRFLEMMKEGR